MDVKTVMFAALGLVVSATATMIWVGNDMERIRAEERAELRRDCMAAAATLTTGTPGAAAGASPTAAGAVPGAATGTTPVMPEQKLITNCERVDIDLATLALRAAAAADPGAAAAATPAADLPLTNPGIAPDPTLMQSSADEQAPDPDPVSAPSDTLVDANASATPASPATPATPASPATPATPASAAPATPAPASAPSSPATSKPADGSVSAIPLS